MECGVWRAGRFAERAVRCGVCARHTAIRCIMCTKEMGAFWFKEFWPLLTLSRRPENLFEAATAPAQASSVGLILT